MKPICLLGMALMSCVLGCSYGSVALTTRPEIRLKKGASIQVVAIEKDTISAQRQLEHLLFTAGFVVLASPDVAEQATKAPSERQPPTNAGGQPDYIVRFGYKAQWDITRWIFRSFSANVTSASSRQLVASGTFSGVASMEAVLAEFVDKLAAHVE